MLKSRGRHVARIALVLTAAVFAPLPSFAEKIALKGGTIITMTGDEFTEGVVLIDGGKITAVGGADLQIPFDATVIDVTGKVIFPGMVLAHTDDGLDIPNENLPVASFVDVYDSIDPSSQAFENALRDGITTLNVQQGNNTVIAGMGRAVKPIGMTVEEMTAKAETGLKVSIAPRRGYDRMMQMATLRETFAELEDYLESLAETKYEEKLEEEEKKIDVMPDEARKLGRDLIKEDDLDDKHRNLHRLKEGRIPTFVYCALPMDVPAAARAAKDYGFLESATLLLGPPCFKAMTEIRELDRPVILDGNLVHREIDSLTGKETETFVPAEYASAGVPFALLPAPNASYAERFLWYQAARCVREGVPRRTALEAITVVPARILRMEDRVGSISPGCDANLLVLTGDPLDMTTRVEKVFVDGRVAYEIENDIRLKRLLEGLMPESADVDAHPPHDDGETPEGEGDEGADPGETPDSPAPPGPDGGEGGDAAMSGHGQVGGSDLLGWIDRTASWSSSQGAERTNG